MRSWFHFKTEKEINMSSDQKASSATGGGGCCGPKDHDSAATDKASKSEPAVAAKPGDKEPVPKGAAAKPGSGHCH
jgi:hypothetical protein